MLLMVLTAGTSGKASADRSEQVLEKHLLRVDVFIREGLQV